MRPRLKSLRRIFHNGRYTRGWKSELFSLAQRLAGVIGALGRSEELDTGKDAAVAKALRQAAHEVSHQIGGQMDRPKTDVRT